jgi:precorrin-6A/cobalt-precorrin-6A reductase
VVSSFAGVTSTPTDRPGRVRRGGFGGAEGLADYLRTEGIEALVDATHPFAAQMPFHATAAARLADVPNCRLLRPPWRTVPGDRWVGVPTLEGAAHYIDLAGRRRVFLAVGRQSAGVFSSCAGTAFVVRAIEPLEGVLPGAEVILARGPFSFDDEVALLDDHHIDAVVAKNSGGSATRAKLDAARALGIEVVMVERPAQPQVDLVDDVPAALGWLARQDVAV